jgi:hypothetical protein
MIVIMIIMRSNSYSANNVPQRLSRGYGLTTMHLIEFLSKELQLLLQPPHLQFDEEPRSFVFISLLCSHYKYY